MFVRMAYCNGCYCGCLLKELQTMMVSLRRKKYNKSFVGEKRRSARLLALEVVSTSKSNSPIQRKGKNTTVGHHEDAHISPEIGETSNGFSPSNSTTSKIIQHVLDVLELKDTHELFTMPDSMQIDDYAERVKNPSDFATLRQKHIDGMYTTLEHFESDVCTVLKKAMTINDHNTIPYKQAIFLQDQAKQILQSMKDNDTNSNKEIPAWKQKHVRGRKKLKQNDKTAPVASNRALPSVKHRNNVCSKRKQGNLELSVPEYGNEAYLNSTNIYMRNSQSRCIENIDNREESHLVEPRLTYLADYDSNLDIVSSTFGNQNPYLALNAHIPRYQESLSSFTKNAGMKAQKAAEERCQIFSRTYQDPYFTRRPSIFPQISTSPTGSSFDSRRLPQFFPQQMSLYDSSYCKLETDDLLKWFQSIGTPEFVEKGNASHLTLKENMLSDNKHKELLSQQQSTDFPKKGSEYLNHKEISAPVNKITRSKENVKDMKNSAGSSPFNGAVSRPLGFSQYASFLSRFKPGM